MSKIRLFVKSGLYIGQSESGIKFLIESQNSVLITRNF